MAQTPSSMIPLGTIAPDFCLPDAVSGEKLSLRQLQSDKGTVVMFICNHCPFVKHIQAVLVEVARKYQARGVTFVAINSNDVEAYPEDAPDRMRETAREWGYSFPYLFDETQETARAYRAACTPDFFVFDRDLKCVYRGRFDDSRPGNGREVTGHDLTAALDALLEGREVSPDQQPSIGCNIKWKRQ